MIKYKDTDYLTSSAGIRAVEAKMNMNSYLKKLIDAPTAKDVFKVLKDTKLNQNNFNDYINGQLKEAYDFVEKNVHSEDLVKIFRFKYDVHNIKTLIKQTSLNRNFDNILIDLGSVSVKELVDGFYSDEYDFLNPVLAEGLKTAREEYEQIHDPQQVDIIMDKTHYKAIFSVLENYDIKYVKEFFELQVDLINIKTIIRAKRGEKSLNVIKNVFIDGGSIKEKSLIDIYENDISFLAEFIGKLSFGEKLKQLLQVEEFENINLSLFEKECELISNSYIEKSKYIPFGIEVVIAYLLKKELEIQSVRIIVSSKLAGLDSKTIYERLRI